MSVLEVGPGPGTFTVEAARRAAGGPVAAVDVQPTMAYRLRDRLRRARAADAEPIVGTVLDLSLRDRAFDRTFMVAVFGELPDKARALSEVRRVLRDEGLLAIGEFLPDPDCPRKKDSNQLVRESRLQASQRVRRLPALLTHIQETVTGLALQRLEAVST